MRIYILCILLSCGLSSCANHPLQSDVTGFDIADIVKKIRCEAQEQILFELQQRELIGHQNRVLDIKHSIDISKEWLANNKSILSKVDKTLADDDAAGKSLKLSLDALKKEFNLVAKQVTALDELIKAESNAEVKISLLVRHRKVFAKGKVITSKIDDVSNKLSKLIIVQQKHSKKHDEILRRIWPTPTIGTETRYLEFKKRNQQLETEHQSPDLDLKARRYLFRINNTSLALKLDFKVSENNNGTADGALTWPVHLGAISLKFNAGKEKGRISQRIVNTVSLFEELSNTNKLDCNSAPTNQSGERAHTYPITGRIGIGEFIEQYLRISQETTIPSESDTFTDTLTFTTKILGGINPTIEVKPISPSLVTAGIDLKSDRTDLHVVSLQIRPLAPKAP